MENKYRLKLLPPARQQLKFLPARVQNEVKGILYDLQYDPWPPIAEELRDHFQGIWKIKVDGYRIFYQIRNYSGTCRLELKFRLTTEVGLSRLELSP